MNFSNSKVVIGFYLGILLISTQANSAERVTGFSNESAFGLAVSEGNSNTQSLNLKQMNKYFLNMASVGFSLAFYFSKNEKMESAKNTTTSLRFDRLLKDELGIYLSETFENNKYAGIDSRYSTDIGAKYIFSAHSPNKLSTGLGYLFMVNRTTSKVMTKDHYVRAFAEYEHELSQSSALKVGLEGLPNLSDSEAYKINLDATLLVAINEIFTLQTAYKVNFNNKPYAEKKLDSLTTTSVVAKF